MTTLVSFFFAKNTINCVPTIALINFTSVESTTPPIPPSPANYEIPTRFHTSPPNELYLSNSHVLDTILDELNAPTDPKIKKVNAEVTATFKYKIPPRPPER